MESPLTFTNWSLKKAILHAHDPIIKARVTVFYYVFIMNFLKIAAVLPLAVIQGNTDEIRTCLIGFVITLAILKVLLSKPDHLEKLIHFALSISTFMIWDKIVINHGELGLVDLQDIFMICMWSFYGLMGLWGFIYSSLSSLPVLIYMLINGGRGYTIHLPQNIFEGPLFIMILNFFIIVIGHFYYRNILYKTISERERLNEELEKSNEDKVLFFSTMSHELRTPLNSVIGMANLLIDDNKDREQKENLDILKFSAESLLSLINDILDFNKIDSGKVALESIPFNLKELLENACAGLKIKASEKGLYCRLDIAPEIGSQEIMGDPTRLLQIVYNLMGNAIKFTRKGGVELKVGLIKKEGNLLSLRFEVNDTGLGISPVQQKNIFEPFSQASRNTTRKYGGTGLGLAIVKHLLRLHHSDIHLESELNAGARFYFDIDYPLSEKQPVLLPASNTRTEFLDISQLKVLLAEDNLMNILFMKKLFSKWGLELVVAENGAEAVKLLEENSFDLVLMDLQMPVMNGYEATVKIRQLEDPVKSSIYIIALTASVSSDIYAGVLEVGMNDCLSKPFKPEELYEKLKKLDFSVGERQ